MPKDQDEKTNGLNPAERKLWRRVTRDVKPLEGGEVPQVISVEIENFADLLDAPEKRSPRRPKPIKAFGSIKEHRQGARQSEDVSRYQGAELDKRTEQRFVKGLMPIERQIDLHGLGEAAAHEALARFIEECWCARVRVLLVITGKGKTGTGVLKHKAPIWLNEAKNSGKVLRVQLAQQKHGGEGALYVLLRRQRT